MQLELEGRVAEAEEPLGWVTVLEDEAEEGAARWVHRLVGCFLRRPEETEGRCSREALSLELHQLGFMDEARQDALELGALLLDVYTYVEGGLLWDKEQGDGARAVAEAHGPARLLGEVGGAVWVVC